MSEYIEREELVRQIICNMDEFIGAPDDVLKHDEQCNYAIFCVESAPAADVTPVVHAMWIPSESDFDDDDTLFDVEEWCDWQCSACREDICYDDPMPMRLLPKYCPNCGAKMDGGDNNATD